MKTAHVHAFLSENLRKMYRSRHCSEGLCKQRTIIKKLIGEWKMYEEVQKMITCSAIMIFNALKWKVKPERRGEKTRRLPFKWIEE